MIGFHHDLKPQNILVKDNIFLLADFGLSRFKDSSESSSTQYRIGQGDYLAPECENLDGDLEKFKIHRSSDIWSFGCIVSEILTYMIHGPSGVAEFRVQRLFRSQEFRFHHFHRGPGQPNPAVARWLSNLAKIAPYPEWLLVSLIQSMLSILPPDRPTAKTVAEKLRLLVITDRSWSVSQLFSTLLGISSSTDALIESRRFESWKWTCGVPAPSQRGLETLAGYGFRHDFHQALASISSTKGELEMAVSCCERKAKWFSSRLRHLVTQLVDLLPASSQQRFRVHFECRMVETQDLQELERSQLNLLTRDGDRKTGMLTSIKRMTLLAQEHSQLVRDDLLIDSDQFECQDTLGDLDIGIIRTMRTTPVLVEYMTYETSWVDEQIGTERLVRVEAIADLLNTLEKPEDFRALHCSHFFHDEDNGRFGLVFDYPCSKINPLELEVTTLGKLLDQTKSWERFPALDSRFKLASMLSSSILEFHKVGWIHRRFTSSRVAFFNPSANSRNPPSLMQPYITGFSQSRPNDPYAFTDGAASSSEEKAYHHLEYAEGHSVYRQEFDYYSLDLVLLEIGLWKSLLEWVDVDGETAKEFRDRIIQEKVPRLKATMGSRYFEVVETCLRGRFEIVRPPEDTPEYKTALLIRFDELVIQQLSKCSV